MNRTSPVPVLPENSPFSPAQRAWLNGFVAGLLHSSAGSGADSQSEFQSKSQPARPVLVLFGSQNGTSEQLAGRLARIAGDRGFSCTVAPLNQLPVLVSSSSGPWIIVTSTWGDGDPPDNALEAWKWLESPEREKLSGRHFAVLALGDRNYSDFCGAGKKFDSRLEALGASRLVPRADCDLDFEAAASAWMNSLWTALETLDWTGVRAASGTGFASGPPVVSPMPVQPGTATRENPRPARLKTNRRLNSPDSGKETRHFEIVLGDDRVRYEPGDALGVVPRNCPVLVEELLATLGFRGEEVVPSRKGGGCSLHEALVTQLAITQPSADLLAAIASRDPASAPGKLQLTGRKVDLDAWLFGRDIVDLLRACPGLSWDPAEFCSLLRPLQPRLYSISSSLRAHPGEVHLTVAAVRYEAHGRAKKGVASCWLADRVQILETEVPVFIQTSHSFRLPTDPSVPVIMVGPGTGIAPFRAFLEERLISGAVGRNWLFFGDQRREYDFLYREEIEAWHQSGFLTSLDLAFSRDQSAKVYVQNRMLEKGASLWEWLESGAHFYVCGDAKRMARDVEQALLEVIRIHGGKSTEDAEAYLTNLRSTRRYQRDVY